jgi:hypothetical protein
VHSGLPEIALWPDLDGARSLAQTSALEVNEVAARTDEARNNATPALT